MRLFGFGILASAAVCARVAHADVAPIVPVASSRGDTEPAPETTTDPKVKPPPPIEEVRVTAPAPPRSASEVVHEKPVLSAAPHRTASDLIATIPGITIAQHSGEGAAHQIFFRGFDAVHGQDVEIWVGGAPVNDVSNIHGQGYADLHFVMPEVVKRIRSLPGTYDPRQGDFSVAGSLWLDLGYNEPGVTASATVGQFNSRRYFLAYHPKGEADSTFAAFEFYSTDGFGPSRAARRVSFVGQTERPLGDAKVRVMASSYAARFDSAGVLKLSDITSGKIDRFGSYDQNQGGDATRTQIVIDLNRTGDTSRWSFAPYVVFRSMRLRQDFTGYLQQPYSGTAEEVAVAQAASLRGNSEQQIHDAVTIGLTTFYRRSFHLFRSSDSFEVGMSARSDWIDQSQRKLAIDTGETTFTAVDAKVRATDIAGYFDLGIHPLSRLTLRGGVRVDGLAYATEDDGGTGRGERRSAQGANLGKKATADVNIGAGVHALLSYGEGFRSPQARSLQEGQDAPFTRVQSYEGGFRYQSRPLQANAAVFRTTLSDDLLFDQATARNERIPATERLGVTAQMVAQPVDWFVSSASVTYTRASFSSTDAGFNAGDLVPYAPQVVARTDVAWKPTITEWLGRPLQGHFGAGTTYIARRPLPFGEFGNDTFLVDATASLRLKEVQLRIDAFNLLGLNWYDGQFVFASNFERGASPSLVPQRHVTVGAPRTVMATLALYL